ncbi:MAG: DUF5652 family protein [Actinomycetota bacterium]|nr:DUF5652 family protein [Actinomycetota bacterium]
MSRKWHDLSPHARQLILIGAAVEGVLKCAALADLARRPAEKVRGSKPAWAVAIILLNTVGVAPILYFRKGRRT